MVRWSVVDMKILLELIIIFLGVSLLMFLILNAYANRRRINKRINEFLSTPKTEEIELNKEKKQSFFYRFFHSIALIFKNVQFSEKTVKLLQEAGSKLKPEEFFALRIIVGFGIGMAAFLLGIPWYLCFITIIAGFGVPKFFVNRKRKKRLHLLSYQLIEVLGMMANSMRAGFSFMQAMQLVGKEVPDPLGPEFDRVIRQAGLGIPLDEVFEELVERLPNDELEVVIQAILAQRKSGGNLAELLETMEETIRGRVRILEELKTLTAQGRMSSWIITLLPIGLGLYLALVSRDYFSPMLHHPLGWFMLFIAAAGNILGWILIQKIVKIEV